MKRFISAVLSTAVVLSCLSTGVYAEAVSESYTIDTQTKIISKVAPLTKVSVFKNNITGAETEVVNVDGTVMDDDAYATENVFAKIDGELYGIDVEYAYAFCLNGCVGMIKAWLSSENQESTKHMAELTYRMIENTTHNFLRQMSGI